MTMERVLLPKVWIFLSKDSKNIFRIIIEDTGQKVGFISSILKDILPVYHMTK